MSTTLPHDGLVVLRALAPNDGLRKKIVVRLCMEAQNKEIDSDMVDMALAVNGIDAVKEHALQEIADFINWI